MLYLDLTHTSHSTACTGIQRLARSLYAALAARSPVVPVCYDPFAGSWRPLDAAEEALAHGTALTASSRHRGTRWSTGRRLRSWLSRLRSRTVLPMSDGFVCPELFSPQVATHLPEIFARTAGPRVAFFFDAIPLTHPEFTPPKTVARFPSFMQELLRFDGVAAISQTSADYLTGYWQWLGASRPPPVTVVPLGADDGPRPPRRPTNALRAIPQVLCVSSIEGRKNHLALLQAAEALWAEGLHFELRLVGLPRPETAAAALAEIGSLQAAGRPLRFDGVLDAAALEEAWEQCTFTVYPSLIEGFGLPIVESLQHGKPCLCAAIGATGELVAGGGCIGVGPADAGGVSVAIRDLLVRPGEVERLAAEARQRALPTWDDCARHLTEWMASLPHADCAAPGVRDPIRNRARNDTARGADRAR